MVTNVVDVIKKQDTIFVRRDIISKEKTPALLKWKSMTNKREKLPCISECNAHLISYREFLSSENLDSAQKMAKTEFNSEPLKSILNHQYFNKGR